MGFPLICHTCGSTGSVDRVVADLQCKCGSTDLDMWDGQVVASQQGHHDLMSGGQWSEDQDDSHDDGEVHLPSHLQHHYDLGYAHGRVNSPSIVTGFGASESDKAYTLGHQHGMRDHGYDQKKQGASGGTGWNQSRPDQDANWDEYAGPTPSHNPRGVEDADANHVCPVCNGTGHDQRASGGGYDETTCRNCHGTGKVTYASDSHGPTNDAHVKSGPPLGASDNGGRTASTQGFVGGNGTYATGVNTTWTYAGNQSRNVIIPSSTGNKAVPVNKSDKLIAMATKIRETNSGLTPYEAFVLADRALSSFPEDGK